MNSMKSLPRLMLGVLCTFSLTGIVLPSQAHAASMITKVTPASGSSAVSPASYDVFLDANDPLAVTVNVTVPATPSKLDLFLLEDLSSSFRDDLVKVRNLVPNLTSSIKSLVADTKFGVGSFIDKPIEPFGRPSDYVYKTDLALTSDTTLLQSTVNALNIGSGKDTRESQLEALLQTAVRANTEIGFRNDAFKVVVLSTDAAFHKAGDFSSQPANNGDHILDGEIPGTGEDYPSIEQVKEKLQAAKIIPIFAVTSRVIPSYRNLVTQLGFGSFVELSADSSNLISAINAGLKDVFRDITLTPVSDDYGYVQRITPDEFANVPIGASRTFTVDLLADGVGDADDTLKLVAPGFGETLVNVKVEKFTNPRPTPEPATLIGLLGLGALGLTSQIKGRHSKQ